MNRAHANAREDTTELERVAQEISDIYFDDGVAVSKLSYEVSMDLITTYAQTVAEEAVREEKQHQFIDHLQDHKTIDQALGLLE